MIPPKLAENLNGLSFPRKLFLLATSPQVLSIRWARNGSTIQIDSLGVQEECFMPQVFNVKSNQHVLRQLSYYNFEKIDQKSRTWEFRHKFFKAGRQDLLPLVKRQSQRMVKNISRNAGRRYSSRIRSKNLNRESGVYSSATDQESHEDSDICFQNPEIDTTVEFEEFVDDNVPLPADGTQETKSLSEDEQLSSRIQGARGLQTSQNCRKDSYCDDDSRSSEEIKRSYRVKPYKKPLTRAYMRGKYQRILPRNSETDANDALSSTHCAPSLHSADACIDVSSINNHVTSETKLKNENLANRNAKFIIENLTGQILVETPTDKVYVKPRDKNILLELTVTNGSIYYNSGRKRIHDDVPRFRTTDRLLLNSGVEGKSIEQSNPHFVSYESASSTCLPVTLAVLKNDLGKDANFENLFVIDRQNACTNGDLYSKRVLSGVSNGCNSNNREYATQNLSKNEPTNFGRNTEVYCTYQPTFNPTPNFTDYGTQNFSYPQYENTATSNCYANCEQNHNEAKQYNSSTNIFNQYVNSRSFPNHYYGQSCNQSQSNISGVHEFSDMKSTFVKSYADLKPLPVSSLSKPATSVEFAFENQALGNFSAPANRQNFNINSSMWNPNFEGIVYESAPPCSIGYDDEQFNHKSRVSSTPFGIHQTKSAAYSNHDHVTKKELSKLPKTEIKKEMEGPEFLYSTLSQFDFDQHKHRFARTHNAYLPVPPNTLDNEQRTTNGNESGQQTDSKQEYQLQQGPSVIEYHEDNIPVSMPSSAVLCVNSNKNLKTGEANKIQCEQPSDTNQEDNFQTDSSIPEFSNGIVVGSVDPCATASSNTCRSKAELKTSEMNCDQPEQQGSTSQEPTFKVDSSVPGNVFGNAPACTISSSIICGEFSNLSSCETITSQSEQITATTTNNECQFQMDQSVCAYPKDDVLVSETSSVMPNYEYGSKLIICEENDENSVQETNANQECQFHLVPTIPKHQNNSLFLHSLSNGMPSANIRRNDSDWETCELKYNITPELHGSGEYSRKCYPDNSSYFNDSMLNSFKTIASSDIVILRDDFTDHCHNDNGNMFLTPGQIFIKVENPDS